MIDKKELLDESSKCTTCAICISSCPAYDFSNLLETQGPRARVQILNNFLLGKLKKEDIPYLKCDYCTFCLNCIDKCYMLIDLIELFSIKYDSLIDSGEFSKKIDESKKVLEQSKNRYLLEKFERFLKNIEKESIKVSNLSTIKSDEIILIDKIDYLFGKEKVEDIIQKLGKKKEQIMLMDLGSGLNEYIFGYKKVGKAIIEGLIDSLKKSGVKKIIFLSRYDYHFFKKFKTGFEIEYPIENNMTRFDKYLVNSFGSPKIIFNSDLLQVIKGTLSKDFKLEDIYDISSYNELKSWSENE